MKRVSQQNGMSLIESLVALLLFATGMLGLLSMYATAAVANGDASLRSEAANLATRAVHQIAGAVARGTDAVPVAGALATFQANATTAVSAAAPCGAGTRVSTDHPLDTWARALESHLPGALPPIVRVDEANSNQVTIRVCWKLPAEQDTRVFELASYVY